MSIRSVVTNSYVKRLSVTRAVFPVRLVRGVTQFYTVHLTLDGLTLYSARVRLGDPSVYPSALTWSASGSIDAGDAVFGGLPSHPLLAACIWFPGWYTAVSDTSADAYVQFAATGLNSERCRMVIDTSNGTTHTGVHNVYPYVEGFDYRVDKNGGSGQWIGDLSIIDRQAVLDAYNAEKSLPAVIAPPVVADIGVTPPVAETPAVDLTQLYNQVALLSTRMSLVLSLLAESQRKAVTSEQLQVLNSNLVVVGNNSSKVADTLVSKLDTIDGKLISRTQRIVENSVVHVVSGFLNKG